MVIIENQANNSENKPAVGSREWNIQYIMNDLAGQIKNGGRNDPSIQSEIKTGPFRKRAEWDSYCKTLKQRLSNLDYPEEKIDQLIAEATKEVKFID